MAGFLLALIVVLPLIMARPIVVRENGSLYTEDILIYNETYSDFLGVPGNGTIDDFLMMNHYDIQYGVSLLFTMSNVPGGAIIYYIAVFIADDEPIIKKADIGPDNEWLYGLPIDEYGVYGLIIFGHKMSNVFSIDVNVVVLTQ